jgi:DNA modification methylase
MPITQIKTKEKNSDKIFLNLSSVRSMIPASQPGHIGELFPRKEIDKIRINKIKNGFGETIVKINGEIPIDLKIKNGDRFLFISYDQSVLTHGLHKYPAKFFPELPRWLIYKYSQKNEWVLDPFAGSGTANLECLLAHRNSVAVDIDPFARFLTKVKMTPLNTNALQKAYLRLKGNIEKFEKKSLVQDDFPQFPYRDNWFNSYIIDELAYIKKNILNLNSTLSKEFSKKEIKDIIDFFLICFSSIIRSVSNADDNCTRTVIRKKLNKQVHKGDALNRFIKEIDENSPKISQFSSIYPKNIKVEISENGDAKNIKYPDDFFHLAITSPPYVNAVDYPRTHQLEIYWLGIENGSLTPLKKLHVGTESVQHGEYKNLHKIGFKNIDGVLKELYGKDQRRSYILYKFLIDMQNNLSEVKRVLRPSGRYVVVIGNNKMRGILIESWRYLMEMGQEIGFEIENYFASEIIKHFIKVPREERIQNDWVIVFRKTN